MRLVCVGGGPAGLVLAIALKRADAQHSVSVLERNNGLGENGWGLTISEEMLVALRESDTELAERMAACAAPWDGQRLFIRDERADQEGRGYAIGRPRLVGLLADRARALGVEVRCGEPADLDTVRREADVVALCDGMNSASRTALAEAFGTKIELGVNKYVWLGTTEGLDAFTFAFVQTPAGWIWFYGYPYDDTRGTCVVECSTDTWKGLGFPQQCASDALKLLEEIFQGRLAGGTLVGRGDPNAALEWNNFQTITNDRWHSDNLVLVGDAAHTTHFSIGSGTKLAFSDANALARSLALGGPTSSALADYEAQRRPETLAAQTIARRSAEFFEHADEYLDLRADMLLTVMRARRHAWLRRVPPSLYARTYAITQTLPGLRHVRDRIRARIRKY